MQFITEVGPQIGLVNGITISEDLENKISNVTDPIVSQLCKIFPLDAQIRDIEACRKFDAYSTDCS
eukprot:TRINITY_DN17567_c0_g1_i1.p1 TRINITY_DN17567_c0_g1~~TRINITY_DN17567_c0_g1_i1.p1  ORF type:complete len:66 (-),score=1.93 TRINITY_DN17567_c0_g1_i1:353-550(-)